MATSMVVCWLPWPGSGVKVNVKDPTLKVLTVAGAHVPAIPFFETTGSVAGAEF